MPYTAIVNTYLAAKPLFGNAINTTTQFMLNIIGISANTPVSSSSIDYPTVEDPDPIVIPDDPTPAPPEPPEPPTPTDLVDSIEGWSCSEDYIVHTNDILGTVSSSDPRLTYTDVHIGTSADDVEGEYHDPLFNGEGNSENGVPAGCYGDGIAAQVTFSNGVQGFAMLSKVPPEASFYMVPYGTSDYNVTGAYPCEDLYPYDDVPGFSWDYYWLHVVLMSTNRMFEHYGGLEYNLYIDFNNWYSKDTCLAFVYTYAGMMFHMYFIMFESNDKLDYPLTINSNVPEVTVDFPFEVCDYSGYEIDPMEEWRSDEGQFGYVYKTKGYEVVKAIAQASGLTVLGTQSSLEGWSCSAAYMTRPMCMLGTLTNSAESDPDYQSVFVCGITHYDDEPFEPNPYTQDVAGCYGDGIGAHVVFANGAQGYVVLAKIPHSVAGHCATWYCNRTATYTSAQNGYYSDNWYGSDGDSFIASSACVFEIGKSAVDYEEYQASQSGSGSVADYMPSITVDGIKLYMHYVFFKTTNDMTADSNVPTINLNFDCYRCDETGNPSASGDYYHTNRQAIMQAIITSSGFAVSN